jgi:hypothetical protein
MRALDGAESFEGKYEDPQVCDDVESGGCYFAVRRAVSQTRGRLTVEEGCCVDAAPLDGSCEIPHLLNGSTLSQSDNKANEEENGV